MKKSILIQTGTRIVNGEEVPVMEARNVEMTEEEIAELTSMPESVPSPKTAEERIAELEAALEALLRGDTE